MTKIIPNGPWFLLTLRAIAHLPCPRIAWLTGLLVAVLRFRLASVGSDVAEHDLSNNLCLQDDSL
jgi:hypothetical protein